MNKDAIIAQIEARVHEESLSIEKVAGQQQEKLPMSFLMTCLRGNRVGDANLYAAMHRGKFLYVERWGRWLYWNGHYWDEDINNRRSLAAVERVCEEYQRILLENPEAEEGSDLAKLVYKRLNVLRDKSGRENLLECAATIDEPLCITGEELDKQPYLLACPNGVIDLRTGKVSPGQPDQYILNACPTEWTGLETPSPAFMEFLHSSFDGDEELIRYILRLLGYGLLGVRDDHIWAIFHGPRGRNGKDTLMKVVSKILGKALTIKIPTAMLLQQTFQRSGSQPEPDIMALRGARIAFASEGEAGQKMAMSKLKDLTGGSIITARGINDKLMTSWEQTHLLFFLTNELPKMKSDDDAFWTRLHAVHWPIRFVDDPQAPDERKRDPHMAARLEEERSGILARLVEGCLDYLKHGLCPPEKVTAYTREQRDQFDDIGQFLHDCCEREEPPASGMDWKTRTPGSEFAAVCNWWCKKTLGNAYAYSPKRLTQTLDRKGIPTKKSSVMYYLGITIRPGVLAEFQDAQDDEDRSSWRRS
ncbi:phage/plasmid primase, P4 family [Megalodesulfovibrio paquesii]